MTSSFATVDLSPEARPPAFVTSVVCGAVALLFLLLGAITGSHIVFGVSIAAAVVSLLAALTWRSQLVASWRDEHRPPTPRDPF